MRTLLALASVSASVSALILTVILASGAGCGPKPAPAPIPMLPGDGDAHVVKPPPPRPSPPPDPYAGRGDLITIPTVHPPGPIELPKLEEWKLGNGLQVYAVRSARLPVMAMQLAIRAGRMHEPRARLGVSELAADMLVKGTRSHDAAALAKAVDFAGGTIATDSTYEATVVSCSVMARSAGTCLDLVSEMITQPAFPEAELTALRDQLVGKIQQRAEDPVALAGAHAQNLLWGNDHIRGWVNSPQSMGSLRRDDVVTWHRQWFVPGNAILVVVGDIDPKRLRGDLERTFGAWRKGPVPPAPSYTEPGLSGTRIRLVDKPGLTQTQIRIAQFGIKHNDARFFDTLVFNVALGGGPGSRLARAVRGDGSKGYTAGSGFDRNSDRGSFIASSVTRSADAVAVTRQMTEEIARMAKDGPTPEEIGSAIVSITGGYGLRFQAAADFSAALVSAELHGFGQEYLTNYPIAVGQVSVADGKRAAAEILDPKAYVVVLVGDAKDIEPGLRREGWRYEKVAYTDPVSPPYVAPDVPVDAKDVAGARKLIDDALVAKGGKAKLAGIKRLRLVAAGVSTFSGQAVPVEIARTMALPDKMRIDATLKLPQPQGDTVVSFVVNGSSGWQRGPDGRGGYAVVDISGAEQKAATFERWREPELILLKAAEPDAKLKPLADDAVDGKPCAVVKLRSPLPGYDVDLYIDKKTKLVSRMIYSEGGNTETDDFSDYRDASGLKIAYKRNTNGAGRSTTLDIKSVELDPKIEPTLFDKPAK
ncbi:MAG TPA: insulinase family protein [Kofleriaceae bacterium]|nr:insulinase family protein [Kofleriaceae bacterium]